VKDLVFTWQLEQDSNPRPSGQKTLLQDYHLVSNSIMQTRSHVALHQWFPTCGPWAKSGPRVKSGLPSLKMWPWTSQRIKRKLYKKKMQHYRSSQELKFEVLEKKQQTVLFVQQCCFFQSRATCRTIKFADQASIIAPFINPFPDSKVLGR